MLTHALIDLAANAPANAPAPGASPTAVGYGGIVVGLAIGGYVVAKWTHINKDGRRMFVLGVVIAVLLGSTTGLFGSLSNSLRQTGDSVGNSITDTTTGNP